MRSPTTRLVAAAAAAALGLGALAAAASSATTTLRLTTPISCCQFNTKTLIAQPGTVRITLLNTFPIGHNVAIRKGATVIGRGPIVVGPGKRSVVAATLTRGTYTFYCSVPGHAAAGMKGVLKVR